MRAAHAVIVVLVAACNDAHHVEILLGPDETTLSRGFTCFEEEAPAIPRFEDLLLTRGTFVDHDPGPGVDGSLTFNIVVDFITLGDGVPACRGEEITRWCETHTCRPVVVEPRYCQSVTINHIVPADLLMAGGLEAFRVRSLPELYAQLRGYGDITENAPDESVIIRVVATNQTCASLTTPVGGAYPPFDTAAGSPTLIGCASSCPVQLDTIKGTVELTLDGENKKCEPEVRACAGNLGALD
jgi:hypothetical protein